jgi:transcription-repair coupling factor (superfamily II helicase)
MRDILRSIEIEAFRFDGTVAEYLQRSVPLEVVIVIGPLSRGVCLRDKKIIFVGEHELFHDRSQRRKQVRQLSLRRIKSSLAQLRADEHVVDREYGVGIYRGLVHRTIDGVQGDFLAIEYADSKLYLPVQHISRVQRFLGADGHKPVLDKLGSQRWARTKQKVRESVISLAGDLLKLYATRSMTVGWRFDHRGAEDERFADGFPYDETPDQAKAIRETLDDMSSDRPMDRLICGDVGFGKTEVAIRAAFKCFEHGRQVVVLVPTTILVEQHKRSFEERFLGYPAIIGAVSRFYKAADNKRVLEELAKGNVDIIIGTHRLLQHDVVFKDLGLVIIDEEHRFGVKQKERLKQMKANVDVLTLTATPIPRTLHMSLLGIRDVSVIRTPPVDRRPIRTYLAHDDSSVVRDAISRELGRGGQVFFVHNRVQSIGHRSQQIKELFPEARIATAHAKMSEVYLENVMKRFVDHELDILISTSIIESGLDVPRANTIIVDNAHLYGLSQLYQIRGRVGRGTRQSYAYLLVPPKRALSEEARERLKVLQAFDELGAGFQLALRDLEIRGAGNLLGKEQSGSVAAVGFELYTDLLKEAVLHLRGTPEDPASLVDPEVKFAIDAFIPETYIPDVAERLLMYQRLADILTEEDAIALAEEISDRFGEPSQEIRNLIDVMQFRGLLRQYAVAKGEVAGDRLVLTLTHSSPLNPERLLETIKASQGTLKLMKGLVLTLQLTGPQRTPGELYGTVRDLLSQLRA